MRRLCTYVLFGLAALSARGQQVDSVYAQAFSSISGMLKHSEPTSFKRAVFEVENAYFNGQLSFEAFDERLQEYVWTAQAWLASNRINSYQAADSAEFAISGAVFHVMTDTTFLVTGVPLTLPFHYDTVDFFGLHDWTKMFVSKLLVTGSGNCHSMPMLYKMLCNELGGEAYLAMAPNHIYLKQYNEQIGWYNTELTSAAFPTDAWIMASGYVSTDAIRSGIYMDSLGVNETLALCLVDLAQGYLAKADIVDEQFVLRCCNEAIAYHPACVPALLVKLEALGRLYQADHPEAIEVDDPDVISTLATLVALGYREIPLEVYLQWMSELALHREKYENALIPNATTIDPP